MAHHITLTDDEYAALLAAADRAGTTVEAQVHEALADRYEPTVSTSRDDAATIGVAPSTFVCADAALLAVAAQEGLQVENPNDHP